MTDTRVTQQGFIVTGTVQGVGFRWWTRRLAKELGLCGTVRNRPDGAVEVRVRAEEELLIDFAARLAEGPGSATVRSVQTFPVTEQLPESFRVVQW